MNTIYQLDDSSEKMVFKRKKTMHITVERLIRHNLI